MRIIHDLRLTLRLQRRHAATTAIAVGSIAVSVAATAVVFAAIKTVLLVPLPYSHPETLVQTRTEFANKFRPSIVDFGFPHDAEEIARRTRTLESVAIYSNALYNLAGDGTTPPEALYGLRVSANLFQTLGVRPMLGRDILPEEDQPGHANEMILSYGLWVRRFNADRNIVGRTFKVDGHNSLIIGVMPPEFNFPLRRAAAHTPSPYVEFWAPIHITPINPQGAVGIVARLRKGVSLEDAEQDLQTISADLSREFPATSRDYTLRLGLLRDRVLGSAAKSLWLLMAAAGMFLLVGCANVANLLLARGIGRQREIAIRIAVGAERRHVLRQILTECCVLGLMGGVGAYALTVIAWKLLPALAPVDIPRLSAARADWTVLAYALAVAVLNGVLFGLVPAFRAGRVPAIAARDARSGTTTSGMKDRTRSLLIVAEVAITVSLVIMGGQLLGKFVELLRTDPGFEADHVVASVLLPVQDLHRTAQQRALLYQRFLDAVRRVPGIESVGTVDALPFSGENHGGLVANNAFQATDSGTQLPAEIDIVSPEYLQTMGTHLLAGRWFRAEEMKPSNDSAIISDAAAKRLWPGEDPIGKRICVYCTTEKPGNWKQVVGVVSTMHHNSLAGAADLNVYLDAGALEQAAFIVVRTNRPLESIEKAIRAASASVDPNQPVFLSATMRTLIADSLADRRFLLTLLGATSLLALIMSSAGVYGVVSYATSRRTQEIGLRMALGATRSRVQLLILRQGFGAVLAGLAIGILFALLLSRVLRGFIVGLESGSWEEFVLSVVLVLLAAAIACWLPARSATKVDPMVALRYE
jgi:predicted permease